MLKDVLENLLILSIIFFLSMPIGIKIPNADALEHSKSDESAQIEVRAVFINCEPDKRGANSIDGEATRFEREELYKHGALQSCNKKLALTVKIASDPARSSDDEYIPIEHVIEGTKKKRQRLLDPYVLRLRREPPLQAYKLRKIDTVSGILTDSDKKSQENEKRKRARLQRDLIQEDSGDGHFSIRPRGMRQLTSFSTPKSDAVTEESCDPNITSEKRIKRHEHNIVVEEEMNGDKTTPWIAQKQFHRQLSDESGIISNIIEDTPQIMTTDEKKNRQSMFFNNNNDNVKMSPRLSHSNVKKNRYNSKLTRDNGNINTYTSKYMTSPKDFGLKGHGTSTLKYFDENFATKDFVEKDFALYEIGNPELWHTVHVQLYEKISTPEGKTVWNDVTKGEHASVSSLTPEWTGQDMSVIYQPAEWMGRDEFTLPKSSLLLLTPLREDSNTFVENEDSVVDSEYIVVPADDIVGLEDNGNNLKNLGANFTTSQFTTSGSQNEQSQRRVLVRTSRAIFGGGKDKLGIASHGNGQYLTLPHQRRHHAQIDLEARADDNQLVRVGSSGRIATVVADSTKPKRVALTVQATNTGLAAARFRAITRDCNPELSGLFNKKKADAPTTNPLLIPPRHTRRFRLEIPIEIPIDMAHCSVALMNDDDESVAVRDVAIKRGDRCFCVWHCDCVCLSEDPKLLCREMSKTRQTAAGLEERDRPRLARSVCYPDIISINIFVTVIGVLIALLFFGTMKACLGLTCNCIGSWGLDRLVQMPRKLDRYYESSLSSLPVEYDDDGWPVHPDSKERTVRLISKSMEFVLNIIFFVTIPCIVIYEISKRIASLFKPPVKNNHRKSSCNTNQECFSTHEMQGYDSRWRRRRDRLRKWMTPGAQELSKDIWQKGLTPQSPIQCEFMQPLLLHETCRGVSNDVHDSYADSEQDDTEYVLMQMQKSRESLAKSQRKLSESKQSSEKHERKCNVTLTQK